MIRGPSPGNINWEVMSLAGIYDNGGGGVPDGILEKAEIQDSLYRV